MANDVGGLVEGKSELGGRCLIAVGIVLNGVLVALLRCGKLARALEVERAVLCRFWRVVRERCVLQRALYGNISMLVRFEQRLAV